MYAVSMSIQSESGAEGERDSIIRYLRRLVSSPPDIAPSLKPIYRAFLEKLIKDLKASRHYE